jgi:hypothetical protein
MAEPDQNRYNIPEDASESRRDAGARSVPMSEFFYIGMRAFGPSFFPMKRMQGGFDFWNS